MAQKKYLKLYRQWAKRGRIPNNGLCNVFKYDPLFLLFDIDHGQGIWYWGYNGENYKPAISTDAIWHEFTPMRQNIVLLMAALNNEL